MLTIIANDLFKNNLLLRVYFLGVVDKSVELLSGRNAHLTIDSILNTINNYNVQRWDHNQQNLEYCITKYGGTLTEANRYLSKG